MCVQVLAGGCGCGGGVVEVVESGGGGGEVEWWRETGCFFRGLQLILLNTLTHSVVRSVANAEQRATMTQDHVRGR